MALFKSPPIPETKEEKLEERNKNMIGRQEAINAAEARSKEKPSSTSNLTQDIFVALQALTAELNEVKYRLDILDRKEESVTPDVRNIRRRIPVPEPRSPAPRRPQNTFMQISLRDALDLVPKYDGQNHTVFQFSRFCKRARDMLPPEVEYEFTVAVTSKLQGHAYLAIEDKEFYTIEELIDHLKAVFSPPKTANQYRGELGNIYMQGNENILDFVSRIKDLKVAILDEEKRTMGHATDEIIISQLEIDVMTAFCNGLPPDLLIRLKIEGYNSFEDAVTKAIRLNKQLDIEASRYRESKPACAICKKKGHASMSCWNNQPATNANAPSSSTNTTSKTTVKNPNPVNNNLPPVSQNNINVDQTSVCKYCKNPGHSLNDCVKLQNRRRALAQQQSGNGQTGRLTDANRSSLPQSRPVNTIELEEGEEELLEELTEESDQLLL